MNEIILWVAVIAVSVLVEAVTVNLVSCWFAVGGFVSLVMAVNNASFNMQLIVFIVLSVIMLILIRPFARKYLKSDKESTNVERLIGKEATVTEDIKANDTGEVKVEGLKWSARSEDNSEILKGSTVTVKSIQGVTLTVEKI